MNLSKQYRIRTYNNGYQLEKRTGTHFHAIKWYSQDLIQACDLIYDILLLENLKCNNMKRIRRNIIKTKKELLAIVKQM